jgi:uncharacterized membrane protein HdeD (DUF308 family)
MESARKTINEVTGMTIGWAAVMILLGLLAVILPRASGVAVSVVLSWLIVCAGLVHLASAFTGRDAGAFIWRLLIGVVYILGGGYLALHSQIALESFTVALAVIFMLESIMEIATSFLLRMAVGSGWILLHALTTMLLAFLIFLPWPASSSWALGTILGINLILSGTSVLIYSVWVRRALEVLHS